MTMASSRISWSQLTRLKTTWFVIQLVGAVLLMSLVFRLFVIHRADHNIDTERKSKGISSDNSSRTTSERNGVEATIKLPRIGFDGKGTNEKPDDSELESVDILSQDFPENPICRKTLFQLWTNGNESVQSTFPSCSAMFKAITNGTKKERKRLYAAAKNWTVPEPLNTSDIIDMVKDCDTFRGLVDFPDKPASKEEADYPLAYVFLPYRNMAQAVRFFRMIYQPQNAYCITYDTKSKKDVIEAVKKMASCFPSNVYINPNLEEIFYSTFTLLHTVMECIDVLRKSPIKWRYIQVVSWNDFPLKTNFEMVRTFKKFNGSQDCELFYNNIPEYVTREHGLHDKPWSHGVYRRPIPPGGLTFYKGSFSTTMSKEFVDFMFTDPVAVKYYYYMNGTMFPDEYFWPTLIHNIHINPPGAFPGQCLLFYMEAGEKKPYMSRFQVWWWEKGERRCAGKMERASCVYGIGDLGMIIDRMELMAHKLYEEFQPALLYCLEEWYWQRVCKGTKSDLDFDFYSTLPSVIYHNLSPAEKDSYMCTPTEKYIVKGRQEIV